MFAVKVQVKIYLNFDDNILKNVPVELLDRILFTIKPSISAQAHYTNFELIKGAFIHNSFTMKNNFLELSKFQKGKN